MFFKGRRLRNQADHLVARARVVAVSSLVPVLDGAPQLEAMMKRKDAGTWDFFATVAAVGVGMVEAYRTIPEKDVPSVEDSLRQALSNWDHQGYTAYLDFCGFIARNIEGGIEAPVAAGAWVLWNIKSSEPTDHELSSASLIGHALGSSMVGAWG